MTGSNVTNENIAKNLVEKIAELLNAEVRYSYLLDHKGVEQRKISITYKEEWPQSFTVTEVKSVKEWQHS